MAGPIQIVSGTNRAGSNSRKVADAIERIYRERDIPAEVMDMADLPTDIFRPDVYANKPKSLESWTARILASPGLVVVTPEYNGGFPGALKYFIDMLPSPSHSKIGPSASWVLVRENGEAYAPSSSFNRSLDTATLFSAPTASLSKGCTISLTTRATSLSRRSPSDLPSKRLSSSTSSNGPSSNARYVMVTVKVLCTWAPALSVAVTVICAVPV